MKAALFREHGGAEKILYEDAVHVNAAALTGDDVLCLTFSGLSKAYRVCGYRAGWMAISGPKKEAADYLEMAARLLRIKAQMLLPRSDEETWEDPRAELVRRLLEYQQMREIVDVLERRGAAKPVPCEGDCCAERQRLRLGVRAPSGPAHKRRNRPRTPELRRRAPPRCGCR